MKCDSAVVLGVQILFGSSLLVASADSVRLYRVVERPEDLATVFADAQTSVTYDSVAGRFYYPSSGLYSAVVGHLKAGGA